MVRRPKISVSSRTWSMTGSTLAESEIFPEMAESIRASISVTTLQMTTRWPERQRVHVLSAGI